MYQNHLEKLSRTRLDDVLLDEGVIERSQIADAQAEHEMTGRALSSVLLERDVIDEWDLAKLIAFHYQLPFLDLTDVNTLVETEDILPYAFCLQFSILPVDEFGNTFTLAVAEMPDPVLLDQIIEISGKTPFLYVAVRRQILESLEKASSRRTKAAAKRAPAVAKQPEPAAPPPREEPKPVIDAAVGKAEIEQVFQAFESGESVPTDEAPAPAAEHAGPARIPVQGLPVVSMKLSASVAIRSRRNRVKEPAPVEAAAAAPAPAADPAGSGWQSIFDLGDDAVRSD